jgi:hypothetical protein
MGRLCPRKSLSQAKSQVLPQQVAMAVEVRRKYELVLTRYQRSFSRGCFERHKAIVGGKRDMHISLQQYPPVMPHASTEIRR